MIICPKCKNELKKINNTYKCCNNHSFDIAKEGYVNLLLNRGSSGDNLEMIKSRIEFLEKGFFENIGLKIIDLINEEKIINPSILDIGCADGYYTNLISKKYPNIMGIDISKDAIKYASRRYKHLLFYVASGKELPINDFDCDIILNIFAPHFTDEFLRILKRDGYIIKVTPSKNHLIELKEVLYDNVYLTVEKSIESPNFIQVRNIDLTYKIELINIDIFNLFKMTPYFYKTPKDKIAKLENLKNLSVTVDVNIALLKKHSNQN